jgi:uroporphyrinogen III methyltransferase / synthase
MCKFDPASDIQPRSGKPLLGKTILVTRARTQSEDITTQLEEFGATVIHLPTIEFAPPDDWAPLDEALEKIETYDWIVFTSANGANFFFGRLRELRLPNVIDRLARCVICAIGPATARAIEAAGAVARVVASDSRAEGALTAVIQYAGGEENVRKLSFLIPRARVAREALPDGLRRLGARVDTVEAYQTVRPDLDRDVVTKLFKENSITAITFTSSSTVSNFAELAGMTDLSDFLATVLVACIGPTTAETAARYGLAQVIQPEQYNAAALVESIVKSIGEK